MKTRRLMLSPCPTQNGTTQCISMRRYWVHSPLAQISLERIAAHRRAPRSPRQLLLEPLSPPSRRGSSRHLSHRLLNAAFAPPVDPDPHPPRAITLPRRVAGSSPPFLSYPFAVGICNIFVWGERGVVSRHTRPHTSY